MAQLQEKRASTWDVITTNALFVRAAEASASLSERRKALGLPNPGTFDRIAKEVESDVLLNNFSFTGLRADITKTFSGGSPLFQVSHQLAMGSQQQPPYAFAALYGSPNVFMQANIDNDKALQARMNWRWNSNLVTKTSAQIAPGATGQSMLSVENDYTGSDFTASIKAINPSLLEGGLTGMVTGEYLQSITKRLSLGVNALWQRQAMNQGPETLLTYGARYKGDDWIATARFVSLGALQTSYWRRIAEKVEAGVDLNLSYLPGGGGMMGGGPQADGLATLGAKWDFRTAQVKTQIDSAGRIGCLLEKRVVPMVGVTFVGQIDHVKNEAKLGLSISIEAMSEEVMEQQERLASVGEFVSPPF